MNLTIKPAPVRKSIAVKASPEKAFEIFTAGMTRWWNKQYTIGTSPLKEVVVEPRRGGRWFERGEDGSECSWGKVLAWEPPSRLVLAWQISGEWRFDPDILTELEIRFVPEGAETRVELEHRNLEALGEKAEEFRATFDSPYGWAGLLEAFAGEVAKQG